MLARGVGRQAAVMAQVGVILLDALRRQRLQRDRTQLRNDVVDDHLAVPMHGGRGAVGPHDRVHPVGQPLGNGRVIRFSQRAEVALHLVQTQRFAGVGQLRERAGLFDLVSVRVAPEIQINVVFLFLLVVRNIALNARAGHIVSPSFPYRIGGPARRCTAAPERRIPVSSGAGFVAFSPRSPCLLIV